MAGLAGGKPHKANPPRTPRRPSWGWGRSSPRHLPAAYDPRRRTPCGESASGAQKGPSRVTFRVTSPQIALLWYDASATKLGASGTRLAAYRSARSVGEFFDLHPESATVVARKDLGYDLQ